MKEYPHQLSGGINQRIMIAMALACEPKILIADEPTTALDVTIQAQIMKFLNEIKQRTNMSIILITHDLGLVSQLVEKVIVMYAGKIIECAEIKDIFKVPHHPYTKGLLNSIPRMKRKHSRGKLTEIPGTVPNLIDPIKGCAFHPRCAVKLDKCIDLEPELKDVGKCHASRCWLD
jgi:oligopeptide/dipeptide ABC transporter ATP-binding protein